MVQEKKRDEPSVLVQSSEIKEGRGKGSISQDGRGQFCSLKEKGNHLVERTGILMSPSASAQFV